MSDPRLTLKIHDCAICYKAIYCTGDCRPIHRILCAVCAAQSGAEK